jgi:hypothetical protein
MSAIDMRYIELLYVLAAIRSVIMIRQKVIRYDNL